jgi:hypothetical protein
MEPDRVGSVKYQPTVIRDDATGNGLTVNQVADMLVAGTRAVLLGDYGMGKSVTLREVFLELRKRRIKGQIRRTPVLLNLRDHWGQRSEAEALERHAREIGFSHPNQLVRALHAGRLIIMLDGFDETASIQWSPRESARMREARRSAVGLAKKFADMARNGEGFIVAGRDHFFDSRSELDAALGLGPSASRLILDGFSIPEMQEYLRSRGFTQQLPDWLPNRPLLLGYLSRADLIGDILSDEDQAAPSRAWDAIVARICEREASIHEHLDSEAVRRVLETLASSARSTATGLGPISERDVFDAFRRVTSMDADEVARPLLMRLPCLSARDQVEGGRSFLDDQLLDVLRAGDVVRFAYSPYEDPQARSWDHCMGPVGVELAADRLRAADGRSAAGRVTATCAEAIRRWGANALALDLMQMARAVSADESVAFGGLTIEGGTVPVLDLGDGPLPSGLTLRSLVVGDFQGPESSPTDFVLHDCLFERVFGFESASSFPAWIQCCDAVSFDDAATNADIMRSDTLPVGVRVALTMLRKLFLQRGHGRKENALSRGMGQDAQSRVRSLLPRLHSEGIAFATSARGTTMWHPVQGQRRRVQAMLDAPGSSSDPFLVFARSL